MQAKKLTVKNIGILTDIEIEINKPLIIFYGDIRQGKTTILESIKLLFGGGFSKDLIRHGEKEAFVKLELDNGYIKREWYRSKENEVKSRQIEFVRDGELVKGQIVNELANYVNPFLLDQNYFRKMNKIDKAKFLLEIFGVDISDLKKENGELELKARELRQKIKMYGDIDLTKVEKPDIDSLKSQEQKIRSELNQKYSENKKHNSDLRAKYEAGKETQRQDNEKFNQLQVQKEQNINEARTAQAILNKLGYSGNELETWILNLPEPQPQKLEVNIPEPEYIEEMPDQTPLNDILEKLSNTKADQLRYEQYQKNLESQKLKDTDISDLASYETRQREIKKESAQRLRAISNKIDGLIFDDNGDFTYLETASDMLSDSMQMELSSKLSGLYPEGLKLELIDQGESLGKSIFKLIDHAKENSRNILVTKVGDKDTNIPEEIGVFVVENGNLK